LTKEEQIAFGTRFGNLELADGYETGERGPAKPGARRPQLGQPIIGEIANVDENGQTITDPQHRRVLALAANEGWHSDSSYKEASAKASILAAIEVPSHGGQTAFADMRAAYETLPPEVKNHIDGLKAWHSVQYSQTLAGATGDEPAADPLALRGAWHPLVRRHPATGRLSLFIGRHACAIDGMDHGDAQALLAKLLEDACQPPRVYVHNWTVGDVVMWDNRCMLHQARPWDISERRMLRHVRIAGPGWASAA
jgi:alpha-ketoglutarate-dependent taurine dioxygenase